MHIVDVATKYIANLYPRPKKVGIIATEITLKTGMYQQRLAKLGIEAIILTEYEIKELFVPGCYAVKRGENALGGELFQKLAEALISRGAEKLILGCTEIPVALKTIDSPLLSWSIDPAYTLAEYCVKLWQEVQETEQSVLN